MFCAGAVLGERGTNRYGVIGEPFKYSVGTDHTQKDNCCEWATARMAKELFHGCSLNHIPYQLTMKQLIIHFPFAFSFVEHAFLFFSNCDLSLFHLHKLSFSHSAQPLRCHCTSPLKWSHLLPPLSICHPLQLPPPMKSPLHHLPHHQTIPLFYFLLMTLSINKEQVAFKSFSFFSLEYAGLLSLWKCYFSHS